MLYKLKNKAENDLLTKFLHIVMYTGVDSPKFLYETAKVNASNKI